MIIYLLDAFSGPASGFMYTLLGVGAFELAVIIDRTWTFFHARCDAEAIVLRVQRGVERGERPTLGTTPLESVVRAGIAHTDPDHAWEAMATASVPAELRIRRRVGYLSTIASVATMIGLFGTVYGLIQSFGSLGDTAAAERAAHLAEGTSTAMAATAFGLLIAIPALAAHAVFESMARELLGKIEETAGRVVLALRVHRKA